MRFHPLADLFPLMQGREFDELVADIKAHGLREPITTLDGMILDGRNRWRACEAAGAEPRTCEYHGEDPLGWVVSLNLHRRHLDESQRAIVAAKIANLGDGQRKSASPIGERAVTQSGAAVTPREGRVCPICGSVMEPWADRVCDQCEDWQEIDRAAEAAAEAAQVEADRQRVLA